MCETFSRKQKNKKRRLHVCHKSFVFFYFHIDSWDRAVSLLNSRQRKCSPGRFRSLPKGAYRLSVGVPCRIPEQSESSRESAIPLGKPGQARWTGSYTYAWLLTDRQLVQQSRKVSKLRVLRGTETGSSLLPSTSPEAFCMEQIRVVHVIFKSTKQNQNPAWCNFTSHAQAQSQHLGDYVFF